jgi:hypothetical protein
VLAVLGVTYDKGRRARLGIEVEPIRELPEPTGQWGGMSLRTRCESGAVRRLTVHRTSRDYEVADRECNDRITNV